MNECTDGHSYDIWTNNGDTAKRKCLVCGYKEEFPLSSEIKAQIEREKLARKLCQVFIDKIQNNDENLLNYLNVILSDEIYYLSASDRNNLKKKMTSIIETPSLDNNVKVIIDKLSKTIDEPKIDLNVHEVCLDELNRYIALEGNNIKGFHQ